jgi:hypothetical protein
LTNNRQNFRETFAEKAKIVSFRRFVSFAFLRSERFQLCFAAEKPAKRRANAKNGYVFPTFEPEFTPNLIIQAED